MNNFDDDKLIKINLVIYQNQQENISIYMIYPYQ